MAITLVVADDHEAVRTGVASMLKGTEIKIVGEAANAEETVSVALSRKPDVLLLDIRMGEEDGFAALEKLRKKMPEARVVMFSAYDNPSYVARAVTLGAVDYMLKDCSRAALIAAIERAATEETPDSMCILQRLGVSRPKGHPAKDNPTITDRERQVVRHVALGMGNREIGAALGISVETVKEHVQNILRKINAHVRTQIAVWAVKNGLA